MYVDGAAAAQPKPKPVGLVAIAYSARAITAGRKSANQTPMLRPLFSSEYQSGHGADFVGALSVMPRR